MLVRLPQVIIYSSALSRFKRIILSLFDLVMTAMVFRLLELARGYPSVRSRLEVSSFGALALGGLLGYMAGSSVTVYRYKSTRCQMIGKYQPYQRFHWSHASIPHFQVPTCCGWSPLISITTHPFSHRLHSSHLETLPQIARSTGAMTVFLPSSY